MFIRSKKLVFHLSYDDRCQFMDFVFLLLNYFNKNTDPFFITHFLYRTFITKFKGTDTQNKQYTLSIVYAALM